MKEVSRRHFLKIAGIGTFGVPFAGFTELNVQEVEGVSIVLDPSDAVVDSGPARWAADELERSLTARGIRVDRYEQLSHAPDTDLCIVTAGFASSVSRELLKGRERNLPEVSEALGLVPVRTGNKRVLLTAGRDVRGVVYALLELADRVNYETDPLDSLNIQSAIIEQPANEVRSLNRLFVSDVEDKVWFNDREMWPQYLTMLATQRFNRFNMSLGIGYDFLRNVEDAYFLFAYPFLLSVPGYDVRVPELPDSERDSNLKMLRFISEQTVARGMRFQLGIWMHGYEWINSPDANYTVEGLTSETHALYCRDALRALLQACPDIGGVTIRIHGESGVNEGSYEFWETVFEGVSTCGREVEIDFHSKGIDRRMIDIGLGTDMPVIVGPKYWGEHMGMPYHQADIRKLEIPDPKRETSELMKLSEGSRRFTRYGYGDLLREDRRFGVMTRIWPGTQRLLLWGDPLTAAGHSKTFDFCDSVGSELMEPLSFKGRRGTGIAGGRCGYADQTLEPKWDWEKYLYTLRVFGRSMYNPETDSEVWDRYLRREFGKGAESVKYALANVTRILPVVLTAYACSAGNNTYWPEMYFNQPIVDPDNEHDHPYDTPSPKVMGNVSPLDPQLFRNANDFATELVTGQRSGKYNPVEVAQWIEDYANEGAKYLERAKERVSNRRKPEFRRMAIDVSMQVGLGRFFGSKFRSGVLYGIYEQSGSRKALEEALKAYRKARAFWAELAYLAEDVYKPDITIGERPYLRGHWLDRLPDIDKDIRDMEEVLTRAEGKNLNPNADRERINSAIEEVLGRPTRMTVSCDHKPPEAFQPGQSLPVSLSVKEKLTSVRLYYRHVNHAERYQSVDMWMRDDLWQATIPGAYMNSAYPLQYYFEMKSGGERACLYPGFNRDLTNQPYFVVRQI